MHFTTTSKAALGAVLAGVLFAAPAVSSVRFSDAIDGNWADLAHDGRGWMIDYIPAGKDDNSAVNPSSTLFMYGAVYDQQGKPFWVALQAGVKEFEYKITGVALSTREGGQFGDTWSGNSTLRTIGTADVEMTSCSEIKLTLKPEASTGLPSSTQTLTALKFANDVNGSDRCVVKRAFTGCPVGTAVGPVPRSCMLSGTITQNLTLTNETTWILNGLVKIGIDNQTKVVLTIEPGTVIIGAGQAADYLYVEPGSKIFAQGTPTAPIIFTSPKDGVPGGTPAPKDWGGVVLSGNAPNNKCPAAPYDCRSEFDPSLRYGGNDPHDSSGVLQYVQVRYAGYVFQPNKEVNSFTFESVGDGTVVDHIQAYRGGDDGVEFFGGNVNASHVVITEGGDDGLDWDEGFSGKIQFVLLQHGSGFGEDNGIEASNQNANQDAAPRAQPTVANLTFLGKGNGGWGLLFKEGTGGHVKNAIVSGFKKSCLNIANAPTFTAAGTPPALSSVLTVDHVLVNCSTSFTQDDGAPWTSQAFFIAQAGNIESDPMLEGFLPKAGSPVLDAGVPITNDAFFAPTRYLGAFRDVNDDWTRSWTYNLAR